MSVVVQKLHTDARGVAVTMWSDRGHLAANINIRAPDE